MLVGSPLNLSIIGGIKEMSDYTIDKNKNSIINKKVIVETFKKDFNFALMFLPIFIYYIVFRYIPMLGLILAFKDFVPGQGIFSGDWIGFKHFSNFFNSIYFGQTIRNTVLISLYQLIFGFPVPILFAICITQVKSIKLRRFAQTATYLPHFLSTVIVVGMLRNFLDVNNGIVNTIIEQLGFSKISFTMSSQYFRPVYVGSGIWQSFGFSSIIYIAAILGVNPELYESAQMDGIRKFQEAYYITLPMIKPTIVILLLLNLGGIMSVGFEKAFLMANPRNLVVSDIISTYVYRSGITEARYSYATAVGVFNSIINFILVYSANRISRKVAQASLW